LLTVYLQVSRYASVYNFIHLLGYLLLGKKKERMARERALRGNRLIDKTAIYGVV